MLLNVALDLVLNEFRGNGVQNGTENNVFHPCRPRRVHQRQAHAPLVRISRGAYVIDFLDAGDGARQHGRLGKVADNGFRHPAARKTFAERSDLTMARTVKPAAISFGTSNRPWFPWAAVTRIMALLERSSVAKPVRVRPAHQRV